MDKWWSYMNDLVLQGAGGERGEVAGSRGGVGTGGGT